MTTNRLASAILLSGILLAGCKESTGPCDPPCGPDEECIDGVCDPICDPPCPEGWYCNHGTGTCFYGTPPDGSTDPGWEPEPVCPGDDTDGDLIMDEHEHAWHNDDDGIPNNEDLDSDGDTILDMHEAGDLDCATEPVDYDDDTLPDFIDLDSDNDTIPDSVEAGDDDPETRPRDSDGWGHPDYRDTDSDNDGLGDAQEQELGTDRILADTDGDGHDDMAEIASPSADPLSAESWPGDSERIYTLWYRGRSQYETFVMTLDYKATDVMFLVDSTHEAHVPVQAAAAALDGSVLEEMEDMITGLRTGMALYSGWVMPDAIVDGRCLDPFSGQVRLAAANEARVGEALVATPHCPEPLLGSSLVDAMYHVVAEGPDTVWAPDAGDCPAGFAGACFGTRARHVIFVLHSGSFPTATPAGYGTYHSLDEVTALLEEHGIHVLGLVAGTDADFAYPGLLSLAAETDTRDLTGRELVYALGPTGDLAGPVLLSAARDVATSLPTDALFEVQDGPDWPGGDEEEDAARMVSIWPVGWSPPDGFSPTEACDEMEGDTFVGCVPRTRISYDVYYRNYYVEQQVYGQAFSADLVLSASDGYEFARYPVRLVVPALDGDSY